MTQIASSHPPILDLGNDFYDSVMPADFPQSLLRYRNQNAAAEVGLSSLSDSQWVEHFCRFKPLPDNLPTPLALRYHGHQFLNYNPDLGDGRGFLFAQLRDNQGRLLDLGTKGSGTTPYSRQGDGRLTLKGAVREALATEILAKRGVNTSRTLSVIETGESLARNDEPSPTRSAVLVRLSHSHIRFGTFQRLAHLGEVENIQKLTRYCIQNYYSHLPLENDSELEMTAIIFFREVMRQCASTVAQWMMAGFVHGVMNTDNMNITGESFDYGPYRFLPSYDIHFTAAYFDHQGLYCFGRQPITMVWNLEQLGKSLSAAWPSFPYKDILEDFGDEFNDEIQRAFFYRLNLRPQQQELNGDDHVKLKDSLNALFVFLEKSKANFEQCFFDLHSLRGAWKDSPQAELYESVEFKELLKILNHWTVADPALIQSPYFQQTQCCNLLIDEIEAIWAPIAANDDWSLFQQKIMQIKSLPS